MGITQYMKILLHYLNLYLITKISIFQIFANTFLPISIHLSPVSIFFLDSSTRIIIQTMKRAAANPISMGEVCVCVCVSVSEVDKVTSKTYSRWNEKNSGKTV